MSSVVFGFSTPLRPTFLSKAINSIERRPYSHVYIRFLEPTLRTDMVFQASGLCLNMLTFAEFSKHAKPIEEYEMPLTEAELLQFWNYVLHELGKPYSLKQLAWIFLKKLFRIEFSKNGDSAQICSEAAARIAKIYGIPTHNEDYTTPSDFNKLCVKYLQRVK